MPVSKHHAKGATQMRLSILDLSHPSGAVELAAEAASAGYTRYWIGEHHSPYQCPNPLLLGAVLALANPGLRVGSGGVCLQYHSPVQVAEDAQLVESMVPQRFDLGVARGLMPKKPLFEALLDGRPAPTQEEFFKKLADLHQFLTGSLSETHPLFQNNLFTDPAPPMWVLGLSARTARWAAAHGTGFGFSLHHSLGRANSIRVFREYLDNFKPSRTFPDPVAIIVISGVCAPTSKDLLAWEKQLSDTTVLSEPTKGTVLGTPPDFLEAAEKIARDHEVQEVMIMDLLKVGTPERLEMYNSLAQHL